MKKENKVEKKINQYKLVLYTIMNGLDASVDLLSELDNVSKIHTLERETIDEVMLIMAKKIIAALGIERMSVWLLNSDEDALISMGEYDQRTDTFLKESILRKSNFLDYFDAIRENRILFAENVRTHPSTRCLNESYSIPNEVITLLDIPLRLEGKLIGVMCFEKTGHHPKNFTLDEKSFAFSVSIIFVSNLEARYRRAAQHSLEKTIKEKELLIREMNHRVKNNFSILISLLRINKDFKAGQDPHELLEEYQQRIFSMMKIHDLLFASGNYHQLNLRDYLIELSNEFRNSHPELAPNITAHIDQVEWFTSSKEGLYIGLIITEIFINAVKHVAGFTPDFRFNISFFSEGDHVVIQLNDNGPGFNFAAESVKTTLGLSLMKDLFDELEYATQVPEMGNSVYRISIRRT